MNALSEQDDPLEELLASRYWEKSQEALKSHCRPSFLTPLPFLALCFLSFCLSLVSV